MRIDWSEVDLTRPAKDIADELGVALQSVYRKRKELKVNVPHASSGPRPMCGGAKPGAGRPKGSKNLHPKENPTEPMPMLYIRVREHTRRKFVDMAERKGIPYSELIRKIFEDYIDVE